ncbi:hypothetical protein ABID16_000828 [Rhizobium aquaticum]|uniref:Toxin-antitoxin system HicB family antitoxin n=1 Tax=Rhizobium aquaticum TaxID=1549636 RepID=A0ABV2IVK8_9HYPH
MNKIVLNLPGDLHDKVEALARANGVQLEEFYLNVTQAVVRDSEARKRMMDRAERGKGREEEGLALLRK